MPEQLFTQCATFRINGGCKRSAHLWLNHLKQTELSEQSHIPNIALPPASSQKMEEYWMRLALVICDDGAALGIKVPLIIQVIEAERRRLTVCQNRAQQWCFTRRNKVTAAFQVFVYRAACNALQLATDILRSGIHPSADYFMSSGKLNPFAFDFTNLK
jgi:hypothetical protein